MAENDRQDQPNHAAHDARVPVQRPVNLPPPKPFDGNSASWPNWRQRFDRYRLASGLATRLREEQVSTFLYSMGDVADDIMTTLGIDESKPETTYDSLKKSFNDYFNTRKNIIVDRARFNNRVQREGETVESFIQDLHKLALECNYGALKEDLIRDRIVVGVRDDLLSTELQAKADLTLSDAITLSRQAEARKESQLFIRGAHSEQSVNYMSKKRQHQNERTRSVHSHPLTTSASFNSKKGSCAYCGNEWHKREKCPAREAVCGNS